MSRYLVGIDVGTSSVKCIVICETGEVLSSCSEKYPLYTPHVGWSEQEPADWWEATKKAIRQAVRKSGVSPDKIAGLGFSGQMHGLVALDRSDQVIRRAILWNDQRTGEECDDIIRGAGGLDRLLGYTNNTMLTGFTGGKILWVKKHEPEAYARMASFLMPKDYIRFMITGEKATDASDASGTGLFDVKNRCWSDGLIGKLGLDKALFPRVYESDEVAGYVTRQAAADTGLTEGMPVYAGGGDAVIQTTGMGIVKEGTIGLIIGTSGIVSMSLDSFAYNEGGKLQFFCNNDRRKWQAFGCQLSSGGSVEWFTQAMYEGEGAYKQLDAQAAASPAGAKNLVFLPYLTGERCPHADPYARGVFFGLSVTHGKGDMARAVMEGVTFGLKEIYEIILKGNPNLKPTEVISSGGGSKSAVWRQIQADVFGLPVKTLTGAAEGGAYGGAVVAGVGAGVWESIEAAADCLKVETVTEPDGNHVRALERMFGIYQGLYTDLKDRFKSLIE
jgi:xylulokinase